MANKLYDETAIQNIANSIRGKNGSADTYTVSEMATAIDNIPSGGSLQDLFASTQGSSIVPDYISDYAKTRLKKIYIHNSTSYTSFSSAFRYMCNLEEIQGLDTSNATGSVQQMFQRCEKLVDFPTLNMANATNMTDMFDGCLSMVTAPTMNTANVTKMTRMFMGCSSLTNVPVYDTSSVTTMYYMFSDSTQLTDTSLDNILQMCINAVNYTDTKKLNYVLKS